MDAKNIYQGKCALITGATSGFGYEFARLFASHGFNLALIARSGEKLREVAADLTQSFMVEVLPVEKDLFKPSAAEEIHAELHAKNITVDVLVNDAGQGEHGNFLEYDLARDIDMIQLNITSLVSYQVVSARHGCAGRGKDIGTDGDYESHEHHIHIKE